MSSCPPHGTRCGMRAEPRGCSRTCHRAPQVALSYLVPLIVTLHLSLNYFPWQNEPFPVQRLHWQLTVEFSPQPLAATLKSLHCKSSFLAACLDFALIPSWVIAHYVLFPPLLDPTGRCLPGTSRGCP